MNYTQSELDKGKLVLKLYAVPLKGDYVEPLLHRLFDLGVDISRRERVKNPEKLLYEDYYNEGVR